MAIHFKCPSCSQPIEIDDEWAGRVVVCYYCRTQVQAPSASELSESGPSPVARPTFTPPLPPAGPYPPSWPPPRSAGKLGIIALILTGCFYACFIGMLILYVPLMFKALEQVGPDTPPDQAYEITKNYVQNEVQKSPALALAILALLAGAGLSWLAGIICGILALKDVSQKSYGTWAIALCCVAPVLCCLGVIFSS